MAFPKVEWAPTPMDRSYFKCLKLFSRITWCIVKALTRSRLLRTVWSISSRLWSRETCMTSPATCNVTYHCCRVERHRDETKHCTDDFVRLTWLWHRLYETIFSILLTRCTESDSDSERITPAARPGPARPGPCPASFSWLVPRKGVVDRTSALASAAAREIKRMCCQMRLGATHHATSGHSLIAWLIISLIPS